MYSTSLVTECFELQIWLGGEEKGGYQQGGKERIAVSV